MVARLGPDRGRPAAGQAGPRPGGHLLHADHRHLADGLAGAGAAVAHRVAEDHPRRGPRAAEADGRGGRRGRQRPGRGRRHRRRAGEVSRAAGRPGEPIDVPVPDARLWWPDDPVPVRPAGDPQARRTASSIPSDSYFGMRKISVGPDAKGVTRMLLNNTFVLQNGLLDQGFWPDGLYTAPTDEALRYDMEMTRKLGFNMSRKHIKVEPDRWYYWADKLGVLVWQDMPCANRAHRRQAGETIPDRAGQFERELRRMIEGRFNHPSIVMWVLFNEGMGLEMGPGEPEKPSAESEALMRRVTAAATGGGPDAADRSRERGGRRRRGRG